MKFSNFKNLDNAVKNKTTTRRALFHLRRQQNLSRVIYVVLVLQAWKMQDWGIHSLATAPELNKWQGRIPCKEEEGYCVKLRKWNLLRGQDHGMPTEESCTQEEVSVLEKGYACCRQHS